MQQIIQFITNPQNRFGMETAITLELSVIPIVLAILISIPLGVLVAQRPLAAFLAANLTGLARAIPTLAFLAIALPYLGIGFRPTVVALTALGIPPILLNTVAGLRGIDPAAVDAGRGMGMTQWQVLTRIQIPLVLPVVAAGVRTAAVQVVATVPLAALIGGQGYGDYITAGLSSQADTINLVVGSIAIALLALLVEAGMATLQRLATPAGLRSTIAPAQSEREGAGIDTPAGAPVAVS